MTFFGLVVLAIPAVAAPTYPQCQIAKEKQVSFRKQDADDTLKVSIGAGCCYEAELLVQITDDSGKVVYEYRAPFKQHTAVPWDAQDLNQIAERFVEWTLMGMGKSSELPASFELEEGQDQWQFPKVPDAQYKTIRLLDVPMFSHQTYYEGHRSVVYDPKTEVSVIVLEAGL